MAEAAQADPGTGADAEGPPLIRIRELVKTYRRGEQEIAVLLGLDLDVAAGDFIALMGPSGSGKSTLLNLIAGIDKATSGTIEIAGTDIATLGEGGLADWRAANVGFIFQFYNLMPVLTAFENVELPLLLTSLSARERHERVAQVLALVQLEDRADHVPSELSGGQQQRVAIARALIHRPAIIMADEPTGARDTRTGQEILALFERLRGEGHTIILITHDAEVAAHADRTCVMRDGELHDAVPETAA